MSPFALEYRSGSLYLPRLGLWMDAHDPQPGPERVFVSHAHSDHIAAHREVILSAATARLMETRVEGVRSEHVLAFGETKRFEHAGFTYDMTLLPAGHIFGSAMAWLQAEGETLLYTGDFKLRRGLSAEPCEPRRADVLIMETTFGRPQYHFPPSAAVLQGIVRFCREALDNDETPVLLGYSLGKSQEILCSLADEKFPLMLHGSIWKLTRIYEQFGQCFPGYEPYDARSARGKVLLCPPNVVNSAMLRNLGKTRTAILTGWAVDPNSKYRFQCDAAFPLSDHADFHDLVGMVERVQPRMIYTVHGFAADFAQTLRERGYNAQALSENEQLSLALPEAGPTPPSCGNVHALEVTGAGSSLAAADSNVDSTASSGQFSTLGVEQAPPDAFVRFALACSKIGQETSKLQKIRLLAEHLRSLHGSALEVTTTWFTGRPFASTENKVMQLGWAVLRDALCRAGSINAAAFHHVYLQYSDLGETAAHILAAKDQRPSLTVSEVDDLFHQLHAARGPLRKRPLLEQVLNRSSALEAKYLVKIITGDLRIGLKEGLVEEAIASAFAKTAEEVRQADLLQGNIGQTARLASENRLSEATLSPFRPIKFMLASPEPTAVAIWSRVQQWNATAAAASPNNAHPAQVETTSPSRPSVWLEDKYDGIRCQLHKVGEQTALYSRDQKEITTTFLELADAARKLPGDFILDGEIVAIRGADIQPFAELQKRLGRRQGDLFMREEVPIQFVAFDLLWQNGESQLAKPLCQRRSGLESLLSSTGSVLRLAHITQASAPEEIDQAFSAARHRGNEGLMIKEPDSSYTPGRRGLSWLKLKKAFATLDCVVIGAEYGHGKRSKVLSDYTFAVRDEKTGELKTIGKAYTGLTDAEIATLTQHFLKTAIRQHGRYFEVPPDTVLEIAFDKIQPSERHNSGLALRFPRIVRIRTDKPVTEIDTMASALRLVAGSG